MLELKIGEKHRLDRDSSSNSPVISTTVITVPNVLRIGDKVGFNVRINEQYVYGFFTTEIDSPANSRYLITGFADDTIQIDGPFNPVEILAPYSVSVNENWFWKIIKYVGENKLLLTIGALLIANIVLKIDIAEPFTKLINSLL